LAAATEDEACDIDEDGSEGGRGDDDDEDEEEKWEHGWAAPELRFGVCDLIFLLLLASADGGGAPKRYGERAEAVEEAAAGRRKPVTKAWCAAAEASQYALSPAVPHSRREGAQCSSASNPEVATARTQTSGSEARSSLAY
jgi:hypothetical protein